MPGRPWTEMELQFVRENYANHYSQTLADLIGRSARAVDCKAKEMGIYKGANHRYRRYSAMGKKARGDSRLPLGTRRKNVHGIWMIKMAHDGPRPERWQSEHSVLWRQHHGEIPAGHIVRFKDRDQDNICIENLELVSPSEHLQRNSVQRYPQWLRSAMSSLAHYNRKIKEEIV